MKMNEIKIDEMDKMVSIFGSVYSGHFDYLECSKWPKMDHLNGQFGLNYNQNWMYSVSHLNLLLIFLGGSWCICKKRREIVIEDSLFGCVLGHLAREKQSYFWGWYWEVCWGCVG